MHSSSRRFQLHWNILSAQLRMQFSRCIIQKFLSRLLDLLIKSHNKRVPFFPDVYYIARPQCLYQHENHIHIFQKHGNGKSLPRGKRQVLGKKQISSFGKKKHICKKREGFSEKNLFHICIIIHHNMQCNSENTWYHQSCHFFIMCRIL